jgi:hypothetical protein
MKPQVGQWTITGVLLLVALGSTGDRRPAAAQQGSPGGLSMAPYTGVLTPFGYQTPTIPSDWVSPHTIISYPGAVGYYGPFGGLGWGGQRIPPLAGALSLRPYSVAAGGLSIAPYTGMVTPFGYQAPAIPSDRIIPQEYVTYSPQVIYVPVAVTPEMPAVQPCQVAIVTLRPDTPLADVRVKRNTVVTWVNAGDRVRTLVVEPARLPGISMGASPQTGAARPNGSFSLAFYQPGVYDYYTQDQPDRRARVVVEE